MPSEANSESSNLLFIDSLAYHRLIAVTQSQLGSMPWEGKLPRQDSKRLSLRFIYTSVVKSERVLGDY